MSGKVIVVDENNKIKGYTSVEKAHRGLGKHHRAISVLLYNDRGEVLLQHRKHRVHNNIWDITGSTHHYHRDDGTNETSQEAVYRCLLREYGISEKIPLKILGAVNYFAADGERCENEYDIILSGKYDGKLKQNSDVSYKHKWVRQEVFFKDIEKRPDKYAPWVRLALPIIKGKKFSQFEIEHKNFLKVFEKYQENFFRKKIKQGNKISPLISGFYKDLAEFSGGGKKLRPFLVYLGWVISGKKEIEKILPICLAFELVHSFLLVHDDVIDRSSVRRGKPTIHKKYEKKFGSHYGISQAIILGDIACFEAFKLIAESDFGDRIKNELTNKFAGVLLETGYGEALDVEYSHKKTNLEDIFAVTNLKTARYSFVGPLVLGATAGGAEKPLLSKMTKFALPLGSAYQLTDDILGTFGKEKEIGKSPLSDLREGKNTLLIYKAKELSNAKSKKILSVLWGKSSATFSDLKKVGGIIERSGALAWAKRESEKEIGTAMRIANSISSDTKVRKILSELGDFVVSRKN